MNHILLKQIKIRIRNGETMKKSRIKKRKSFSFSIHVFLIITTLLIIPTYCTFIYLNSSIARYMDEEISSKVVQNVSNSQGEISAKLENLINVSNLFASDPEYANMMNSGNSYYKKSKYFDDLVNKLTSSNIFSLNELRITYFDNEKNMYSNWSVNYNDYAFLLGKNWVKESVNARGYITWNMFDPSFIREEQGKSIQYISLARSFFFAKAGEKTRTGTLIISMDVSVLQELLKKYTYSPKDLIFFCSDGTALNPSFPEAYGFAEQVRSVLKRTENGSGSFPATLVSNKYIVSYYELPRPWNYEGKNLGVVAMTIRTWRRRTAGSSRSSPCFSSSLPRLCWSWYG